MNLAEIKNSQERADKLGVSLVRDAEIDFEKYTATDEAANVRPASDWVEDVTDYFCNPQADSGNVLPWSKTHTLVKLRRAELSVWAGVNGHGKSLILSQIVTGLMQQGERICIASMEMKPLQTMVRMTRQGVGGESPSAALIQQFHEFTDGKLWLYDQQGTVKANRMMAVIRYCREELSITHFVVDSLMKCGMGVDDYNGQKKFVDQLSTYAKDTGLHIHLVAHSRKKETSGRIMDKFDVKGAGEITDMADNVFTLWRNKAKEEKAQAGDSSADDESLPDAVLVCDKQRNGDWEGKINLWFVPRALQYVGKNTTQAMQCI